MWLCHELFLQSFDQGQIHKCMQKLLNTFTDQSVLGHNMFVIWMRWDFECCSYSNSVCPQTKINILIYTGSCLAVCLHPVLMLLLFYISEKVPGREKTPTNHQKYCSLGWPSVCFTHLGRFKKLLSWGKTLWTPKTFHSEHSASNSVSWHSFATWLEQLWTAPSAWVQHYAKPLGGSTSHLVTGPPS